MLFLDCEYQVFRVINFNMWYFCFLIKRIIVVFYFVGIKIKCLKYSEILVKVEGKSVLFL